MRVVFRSSTATGTFPDGVRPHGPGVCSLAGCAVIALAAWILLSAEDLGMRVVMVAYEEVR